MVGMFFPDSVLVAGVAVGRRGPLSFFSIKCTMNLNESSIIHSSSSAEFFLKTALRAG